MNKHKFIELVENPVSVRPKDADILTELARNYPYCSLVHTLLAKAFQESEQAKSSLAMAALYIPDRAVLKSVIENKAPQPLSSPSPAPTILEEETPNSREQTNSKVVMTVPELAEEEIEVKRSVFEELQENLQKLKEQRERFNQNEDAVSEETTLLEKAEDINAETPPAEGPKQAVLPERLQELVENREEQEINDPKRKEQINLIDRFIQNSPSLAKKYRSLNDQQQEQSDLTGNYHFTPEDLVTENLAQIMVRQGKTDKAIDIYEKLVLKYPQKKAYFASCIEKLKTPDK